MSSRNEYYFGIDLGTTNSCISYFKDGMYKTIPIEGKRTVPSCVMYTGDPDNPVVVGSEAYINRHLTDKVVYSCKRKIEHCDEKIYHIDTRSAGEKELGIDADNPNKVFDVSPVEVSAEILKYLKKGAEKYLNMDGDILKIENVIITCPAYFVQSQREATLKAGKLAGFKSVELIIEPTSAAVAYAGEGIKNEEVILIYDLGGGTFDLSALRVTPNAVIENEDFGIFTDFVHSTISKSEQNVNSSTDSEFKGSEISVITTQGDSKLGGDDFDLAIFDYVCKYVEKQVDQELKTPYFNDSIKLTDVISDATREYIICEVEHNKKVMSGQGALHCSFRIPLNEGLIIGEPKNHNSKVITLDEYGNTVINIIVPFEVNIITSIFEEHMFSKTVECMEKMFDYCSAANKGYLDRITKVVLIGGSTKFYGLKGLLSKYIAKKLPALDIEICDKVNPDESVASGASVYAAASESMAALSITDVISQHIGIKAGIIIDGQLYEDKFNTIIKKDALIGIESHGVAHVHTQENGQTSVSIEVYEGDSPTNDLYDKTYLGELIVDNIEQIPGEEHTQIEIHLDVGVDKLLHITAKYKGMEDGQVKEIVKAGYINYSHKEVSSASKEELEHKHQIDKLSEKEELIQKVPADLELYESLKDFKYWSEHRGIATALIMRVNREGYGDETSSSMSHTNMFGSSESNSNPVTRRRIPARRR